MAVNQAVAAADSSTDMSAGRRMTVGLTVTLTILLAIALLVLVNYLGSRKHFRIEGASFGVSGPSQRTKAVLAGLNNDVNITTAYLSEETGKSREKYLPRLTSYCDDLRIANSKVKVTHISEDSDKARLVERLKKTYGGESTEHEKAITDFAELRKSQLDGVLQFGAGLDAQGAGPDRWVTFFPIFVNVMNLFEDDAKTLKTAGEEVQRFTTGGLPKFSDATAKISSTLRPVKDHLAAAQKRLGDLAGLADTVRKPDGNIIKTINDVVAGLGAMSGPLNATVGASGAPAPSDNKAALEAFAAEAQKGEEALKQIAAKLSRLGKEHPSLALHQYWNLSRAMGDLPFQMASSAADILNDVGGSLRSFRQQVLDVKDRGDDGSMSTTVGKLRTQGVPNVTHNLDVIADSLKRLAESLAAVDDDSARLLEACKGGQVFAGAVKAIDDLLARIDKLPELKLGKIADEVKNDNITVIESGAQARVLTFDEVWPLREQINAGMSAQSEDRPRSFNADNAIGGAILGLTSEKPFATIVISTFEVEPPQQARQFMQPQESSIPGKALNTLKERLKAANFAVKDWDLAKPGDPPIPEKDTENLYVFLPPAPPNAPNPFMQGQPPGKEFGDSERKRVQDLLDAGSKAIFLAGWEVKGGFMGFTSPPYGYAKLLKDSWGMDVLSSTRVVEVDPVENEPGFFMISPMKFQAMSVNSFTDHPVGSPFRQARLLVMDACPIIKSAVVPAGVTIEPVLTIPPDSRYVSADLDEVLRMVNILRNSDSGGRIERKPTTVNPPYPIVAAASAKKGERESRIVVFGIGKDVVDQFLGQPVPVFGPNGRMFYDPPPSNNADLVINALHWVRGEEKWIAAGPAAAPAIRAISPGDMQTIRLLLWGLLPALVFIPGVLVWWTRRR